MALPSAAQWVADNGTILLVGLAVIVLLQGLQQEAFRLGMTTQASELQSLRERVSHVLPLSVQERAARSLFQLRLLPEQDAENQGRWCLFPARLCCDC